MKSDSIRQNKPIISKNYRIDSEEHIEDYDKIQNVKEHTIHKCSNYIIRFLRKQGQYEVNIYISEIFCENEINIDSMNSNDNITSLPYNIRKKFNNSIKKVKSQYNLCEKNDKYNLKIYDNGVAQYTKILE